MTGILIRQRHTGRAPKTEARVTRYNTRNTKDWHPFYQKSRRGKEGFYPESKRECDQQIS